MYTLSSISTHLCIIIDKTIKKTILYRLLLAYISVNKINSMNVDFCQPSLLSACFVSPLLLYLLVIFEVQDINLNDSLTEDHRTRIMHTLHFYFFFTLYCFFHHVAACCHVPCPRCQVPYTMSILDGLLFSLM